MSSKRDPGAKAPKVGLCFRPIQAWYSAEVNATGKRSLVFNSYYAQRPLFANELKIPCGGCLGCRMMRSSAWAMRGVYEAREHDANSYITLTYDDEHLPENGSLCKKDFQDFMKRLRKAFPDAKIRYYYCGEYGPDKSRPHYHAAIFGLQFDDLEPWSEREGIITYTSQKLADLWGNGFVTVGEVTYESLAYIARYVMKKITGRGAQEKDPVTGLRPYDKLLPGGEVVALLPEFNDMSRGHRCKQHRGLPSRPKDCDSCSGGIGYKFFDKYCSDVFPDCFLVHKGRKVPAPKYFYSLLEKSDPELYAKVKAERAEYARANKFDPDKSPRRLRDREQVAESYFAGMKERGLHKQRGGSGDPLRAVAAKARRSARVSESARMLRGLVK